ncbi:MAG: glycoside hydrolase family 2 TIM barrel-domain containing protein [bacterium]
MMKSAWKCSMFAFLAAILFSAAAFAKPVPVESGRMLLNGAWKLAVVPPEKEREYEDFFKPDFPDADMHSIQVPLNWEMAGFETAQYHYPTDYLGFYRRRFEAPELSGGGRLMLHFEGVLFGAEVWLNGERLGEHVGGFTGFEFDATDAVRPGGENILAVKVTKKRVKGHEFDCHDAWALSGIYRDVYIYTVPAAHLDFVNVETDLDEEYRDANLKISTGIVNTSENAAKLKVRARLFGPNGIDEIFSIEKEVEIEGGGREKLSLEKPVVNPQKWNAERPVLYPLKIELVSDGKVISTTHHNVGFREVEVDGILLKINGVPVKLKGVNRHEISVERGRALTTEDWLRDIELMKGANINAVRASHYPPDPEFLDLCDKHGFYVIDEAPFGLGDEYLIFPDYLPLLRDRVRETIERDRNHPSVIIWSLGNENPWSYAHPKLIKLAHAMDPTRPLLLPRTGFEGGAMSAKLPPEVDILAPHYPTPDRLKIILMGEKPKKGRPVIMTEYLHALGRNLYTRDLWDLVWKYPSSAGGFVWLWADQGIKRPVDGKKVYTIGEEITNYDNEMLLLNIWKDDKAAIEDELADGYITDTHGIYGADGIVNADRTPQSDYYEIKKIYSPIYIKEESIKITPEQKEIKIHVQNRYDFTNLEGMRYKWRLLKDFEVFGEGEGEYSTLAPHDKGTLNISLNFPGMPEQLPASTRGIDYLLEIYSVDNEGAIVDVHQIEFPYIGHLPIPPRVTISECVREDPLEVVQDNGMVTISNAAFTFQIEGTNRKSFKVQAGEKSVSFSEPQINTWRTLQLVEMAQPSFKDYTLSHFLLNMEPEIRNFEVSDKKLSSSIVVNWDISYGFPEDDEKGFLVKYEYIFSCEGYIWVDYEIHPQIGQEKLLELGMKFELPPEFETVTVIGRGPDTYPGSIENAEVSHLQKMEFDVNDPILARNKTDVRKVVASDGETGIVFEIPKEDDLNGQRNFRAEHDGEKTTLYFNPWVKHPSKKNSDPPPERMVIVKDGDVLKGRMIIRLIEE